MKDAKDSRKKRPPKPLLEPVSEDGSSSFARALGSVDYHTRERGLQALTLYLSSRTTVSLLDMKKLWKGLFYCFWHSDKEPVQEELATRLAAVLPRLSNEVAALYFSVFLDTMEREWFGIDRLRLDKFLMLVRKFIRQLLVYLQASDWAEKTVERYCGYLHSLLEKSDEQTAAGLSFQVADVSVPELLDLLRGSGESIPEKPLRQLLDVFVRIMSSTTRKAMVLRIREGMFGSLIEELQTMDQAGPLKHLDAAVLAEDIFNFGADRRVETRGREALYALSRNLENATSKKRKRVESQAQLQDPDGDLSPASGAPPSAKKETKKKKKKAAPEGQGPEPLKPGATAQNAWRSDGGDDSRPSRAVGQGQSTKVTEQQSGTSGLPTVKWQTEEAGGAAGPSRRALKGAVEKAELSRLAAAKLQELQEAGPGETKKTGKEKAKGGGRGAVTRAAERTLAALNAHKKGLTTVDPATPGSPSQVDLNGWFHETLESGRARAASPSGSAWPKLAGGLYGSPPLWKTAEGTADGSAKRVKFALKRNLYFGKDQPVPDPQIRTPESCRPKGSALKKVSKFPSPSASKEGPAKGKFKAGKVKKSQARVSLQALFHTV